MRLFTEKRIVPAMRTTPTTRTRPQFTRLLPTSANLSNLPVMPASPHHPAAMPAIESREVDLTHMAAVAGTQLVNITVNGEPLQVPKGEMIVESIKRLGLDVPIFCYHPRMAPVGMCRMCLVETGT